MSHHLLARPFVVAAAAWLLSSGLSFADGPPAQDSEQRLKALEAKMDRVLTLLEGRAKPQPTPADLRKQFEMLVQAKERLLGRYEAAQKEYANYRQTSPYLYSGKGPADLANQRVAKLRDRLRDLRQRLADIEIRTSLVKNVENSEKEARALLVLLQRWGVDSEALRRTAGGNEVAPVDLVRLFGESLRLESVELQQKMVTLEEMIEQEAKGARDMVAYEENERRLRISRDQVEKMLDAIVSELQKIDVMGGLESPPKP